MTQQEGVIEQLLRIVRRRKWVVLQALIVVPLIALAFSLSQEDQYTASATLLFRQAPDGLEEGETVIDPTREAATNGQLVGLPVIAEKAAEELEGKADAAEILESVERRTRAPKPIRRRSPPPPARPSSRRKWRTPTAPPTSTSGAAPTGPRYRTR